MKKINSIEFAPCNLGLTLLFLAVIPISTSLLFSCFPYLPLLFIKKLSIILGIVTTITLSIVFLVEFKQDRYMNKYYQLNQNKKILLPNGHFECQHCGYSKVQASSKNCPVCNINFMERSVTNEKPTAWYLRW